MISDRIKLTIHGDFLTDDYKLIIIKYEDGKKFYGEIKWAETFPGFELPIAARLKESDVEEFFKQMQSNLNTKLEITSDKITEAQKEHILDLRNIINSLLRGDLRK